MLRIDENNDIYITRGDKAALDIQVPLNDGFYQFQTTDILYFTVKKKYGDTEPVLRKILTFSEPTEIATINLTSNDTSLGEMPNLPVTYVYDVSINEDQTIIGYDDNGEKRFIVYPEASNE